MLKFFESLYIVLKSDRKCCVDIKRQQHESSEKMTKATSKEALVGLISCSWSLETESRKCVVLT